MRHCKKLIIKLIVSIFLLVGLLLFQTGILHAQSRERCIVVYGDSRYGHDAHSRVVGAIMTFDPGAVFYTGDFVTDSSDPDQWEVALEITGRLIDRTKFYPARGNHDGSAQVFISNFDLPGTKTWYSVDIENIHFVVLDSNVSLDIGSKQYQWLEADLKGIATDVMFTVLIFHHPILNSPAGGHREDERGLIGVLPPSLRSTG